MRKLREILRLKWVAQRSHREVARSTVTFSIASVGFPAGDCDVPPAFAPHAAEHASITQQVNRCMAGSPLRVLMLLSAKRDDGAHPRRAKRRQ